MRAYERTLRDRLAGFLLFHPCLALALLVGGIVAWTQSGRRPELELNPDRILEVTGWVSGPAETGAEYDFFPLAPQEVTQNGKTIRYPGEIAVYVTRQSRAVSPQEIPVVLGERIRLRGYLADPTYYAVPGVPDFRQVYWSRGYLHVARLKSARQIERLGFQPGTGPLRSLFDYRREFIQHIRDSLSEEVETLVRSAFLGQRRVLEAEDRSLIRRLGVIHLFVVSGFHVALAALVLHFFFGSLGWTGRLLTLCGMWSYVLLAGASLPTMRAGLMTSLGYLILSFGFKARFLNVLGMAVLVLLLQRPSSLGDAGFQFSVLSLLTIGLFVIPRRRWLESFFGGMKEVWSERVLVSRDAEVRLRRRIRFFCEEKLASLPRRPTVVLLRLTAPAGVSTGGLLLVGIAVWVATLPLALHYSNLWVWGQALSNLVLVPLFSGFVMLCMLLFGLFATPLAVPLASLIEMAGDLLWSLMAALQQAAGARYWPQPGAVLTAAYVSTVLFAGVLLRRAQRSLLVLPLLLALALSLRPGAAQSLVVTMLDVGQGESLHLRYPAGSHALLDTGGFYTARDTQFVGERIVGRYLWEERVRRLQFVLLSHPHADHTQGWEFLRDVFPTGRLYVHESGDYPRWRVAELEAGRFFEVDGVSHRVLHPSRADSKDGRWKTNDASLVIRLQYGRFSMLFSGDIELAAELELAAQLEPVTVLKAAHHGGRKSNSSLTLEQLRPRVALISAGRRNAFGHPAPETLERLRRAGVQVFSTPRQGSLRVETDGLRCRISGYSVEKREFRELMSFELEEGS